MRDELTEAIANLNEPSALALVQHRMNEGQDPVVILDACRKGMIAVGERFQCGEYFVSELILSAAIFKQAAKMLEPTLGINYRPHRGNVVIGTVKGDVHDMGKDLVVLLLKAANYNVHDLGVDVPPQRFVQTLQETGATVLGLSALLTVSYGAMKETIARIDSVGLRPIVKIMIGGGGINEQVREFAGADAWGANAQRAVDLCNQWILDSPHD